MKLFIKMASLQSLLFFLTISASNGQSPWQKLREFPASLTAVREVEFLPSHFEKFSLDLEALKSALSSVPMEFSGSRSLPRIQLPMPDGSLQFFNVVESPCMQELLSAKYPGIKSYKAYTDDKKSVARFDLGTYGFHASIRTLDGGIYIDPYVTGDTHNYIVYFTRDHNEPNDLALSCGTKSERLINAHEDSGLALNRDEKIDLHTFAMALACTGEWGAVRGTIVAALADMNTTINRINLVFENEFASRLMLINDNDKLIQLNASTDPYPIGNQGRELLQINTQVINTILGHSNYDFGHVYTRSCTDVGGVAFLGSLCSQGAKAAGVTCHYSSDLNFVAIEVAAHEIGHQFGADHTFNNCQDDGNENLGNGFEPGGGSTIMSYGSNCGQNAVISGRSDDYYHQASLFQIYNLSRYTTGGAYGCSQKTPINNTPPAVKFTSPNNKTIPISTYFLLEGQGTDIDGDTLTYNFEEKDAAFTACPLGTPSGACPLFRSFKATTLPYRYFPSKNLIMSNQGSKNELLPTYKRDLNFVITARDNHYEGGVATWANMKVSVDETAGPFRVSYPNIGESFTIGERVTVTWDVANTDNSKVNCKKVNIYISQKSALREGESGLTLLVPNADNDGSEEIIIPNVDLGNSRILIRAVDNVFFDISDFNFTVQPAVNPVAYYTLGKFSEDLCLPASSTIPLITESVGGYNGALNFKVDGLPEGITASFDNQSVAVGQTSNLTLLVANTVNTGTYKIVIKGFGENGDSLLRNYYINVISTDFSDLFVLAPADGEKDSEGPRFIWTNTINGKGYKIQIATDPSFNPASIVYDVEVNDTTYKAPSTFPKKMIYYWRVITSNSCGSSAYTPTRVFGTSVLSCNTFNATGLPLTLSASGSPFVESKINVPLTGTISDINITAISLNHDNFKDLTAYLVAPSGSEVRLFSNQCPKKWNVSFTMDDQAPLPFSCTTANGNQFRPVEPLNNLNGQEINGVWKLKVQDNASGNGGKLEGFVLELCGSVALSTPDILKNNVLQIFPSNTVFITNDLLQAIDAETGATELVFTIVNNVTHGRVQINGTDLEVGSKFTQSDIDSGRIKYSQEGDATEDGFDFIVEDGSGAWTGTHRFNIEIDNSFPNSTKDELLNADVQLFPNPAYDYVDIRLGESATNLKNLVVCDLMGRVLVSQQINQKMIRVSTESLLDGIYIVRLSNLKDEVVKKLIIAGKN